ncbi:MAG: type II secretion system GspH family protein [Candidatus Nitricoxidivorans perseverans]|uniref:Type II secretion system GspH family protein n=1 Tax=Candidatus Nitricoxidivorans perseverans TaxID=2975601 RepID=A0AA49FN46_9PROT|nr:MAG: type II secretion system GspH family protein [Candidatus Nitricoxidivorans perseverans]
MHILNRLPVKVTPAPHAAPSGPALSRGFTLTEMAVVLVIVALLIGGMLMPLSAQQDIRHVTETERILSDVREAMIGYAASHSATDTKPYLPCPDTDDDGAENRLGPACVNQEGRIPWADIGLGRTDAWNNRFRYRVTAAFSNSATGFLLTSNGTLRVCTDSTCTTSVANNIPVAIVSHGKNGAGAFNTTGGNNAAPVGADELENTDLDDNFVSKTPSANFDDLVAWLSPNILFNRMIAAGKLP